METSYSTLLQLTIISVVLTWIFRRLQRPKGLPLPPGPPRDPIIGSLRHFPANDFVRVFSEWKDTYGDIVYANVLGMSTIVLNSPKAIEDLMVDRPAQYQNRPEMFMFRKLCRWEWNTSAKQAGPDHSYERRLLLSSLGASAVKQWSSIIEDGTEELIRQLNESNGSNISKILKRYVGGIVLRIAYGKGIFETHGEELIQSNTKAIASSNWIISNFWLIDVFKPLRYLPEWMPLKFFRVAEESRKDGSKIRDWPFELVLDELQNGKTAHPSFARKSLEDNHPRGIVRDALGIFYLAGLDTTFITLSTFVLAMAINPNAQKKGQSEIDSFIKSENRLPGFEDRTRIPYFDLILKEVWRWNPPVPLVIPHSNTEDDEYSGFRIPKNSSILPNVWRVTHDQETWNDPDEFRPDRFAGPNSENLPDPTQYVFGFGKRLCPGKQLADRMVYLAIVHILALFTIELVPGEELPTKFFNPEFFSFPNLPPVKLTPRNRDLLSVS